MHKIGIWAPAAPCPEAEYTAGLAHLLKNGVATYVPALVQKYACRAESKARPYLAGPDAAKITALKELVKDPHVQHIFCTRGGYGSGRLLPALEGLKSDIRRLGKKQKYIWGFSDLTALGTAMYMRYGWRWVHAPMLTSNAFYKALPAQEKLWRRIFHSESLEVNYPIKVLHRGQFSSSTQTAPLIGGNLTVFNSLLGTPFAPLLKQKHFFFIEDINEKAFRIDRLLTQLANANFFRNISGVLAGHFNSDAASIYTIRKFCEERNLFLATNLKVGHAQPNFPLVMGAPATIRLSKSGRANFHQTIPGWEQEIDG